MPSTITLVPSQNQHQSSPLYCGGNLGLGESDEDCFFTIKLNGVVHFWTVFETIIRLDEFSEAAKRRILLDCDIQVMMRKRYG